MELVNLKVLKQFLSANSPLNTGNMAVLRTHTDYQHLASSAKVIRTIIKTYLQQFVFQVAKSACFKCVSYHYISNPSLQAPIDNSMRISNA